jgi:hypothetical protein
LPRPPRPPGQKVQSNRPAVCRDPAKSRLLLRTVMLIKNAHCTASNISDRRFANGFGISIFQPASTERIVAVTVLGFLRRGLSVPVTNLMGVRFLPTPRYLYLLASGQTDDVFDKEVPSTFCGGQHLGPGASVGVGVPTKSSRPQNEIPPAGTGTSWPGGKGNTQQQQARARTSRLFQGSGTR